MGAEVEMSEQPPIPHHYGNILRVRTGVADVSITLASLRVAGEGAGEVAAMPVCVWNLSLPLAQQLHEILAGHLEIWRKKYGEIPRLGLEASQETRGKGHE